MADSNTKASLGCGTLILIALIVLIFGNNDRDVDKKLREQIDRLQSELTTIRSDLSRQSATLSEIKQSLEESKRAPQPWPRVVPPARAPGAPDPGLLPEAPLPEN